MNKEKAEEAHSAVRHLILYAYATLQTSQLLTTPPPSKQTFSLLFLCSILHRIPDLTSHMLQ